jgi:beta-glucosidase
VETYPGIDDEEEGPTVRYNEGIYVGYRHADKNGIEPRFPFGHGLSYTTFEYSNLQVDPVCFKNDDTITVSVKIKNTGPVAGAEVVQFYVADTEASVDRPLKELKGFQKIFLFPGESGIANITLTKQDLSFYDETQGTWTAELGTFQIHVGSSSRDIRLTAEMELVSD